LNNAGLSLVIKEESELSTVIQSIQNTNLETIELEDIKDIRMALKVLEDSAIPRFTNLSQVIINKEKVQDISEEGRQFFNKFLSPLRKDIRSFLEEQEYSEENGYRYARVIDIMSQLECSKEDILDIIEKEKENKTYFTNTDDYDTPPEEIIVYLATERQLPYDMAF